MSHNKHISENCLFCLNRTKTLRKLTTYESVQIFLPLYNELVYPQKACTSCRKYYTAYLKGEGNEKLLAQIEGKPHVHQDIVVTSDENRACCCVICNFIRSRIRQKGQPVEKRKNVKANRKIKFVHSKDQKRCDNCLTINKKLHLNRCQKLTLIRNIKQICKERNITDDVISSLLRSKSNNGHRNQLITLHKGKKNETNILYKPRHRQMSQKDIIEFQRAINGSSRKRKRAVTLIKKVLGRKAVVSNIDLNISNDEEKYKYLFSKKVIKYSSFPLPN